MKLTDLHGTSMWAECFSQSPLLVELHISMNAFPTAALPLLPIPTAQGGTWYDKPGQKPRILVVIYSEEKEEKSTILSKSGTSYQIIQSTRKRQSLC